MHILKNLYHKISLNFEQNKKHETHTPQEIVKQIRGAIRIGNVCFIILAQYSLIKIPFFLCFVCLFVWECRQATYLFCLVNYQQTRLKETTCELNKKPNQNKNQPTKKDTKEGSSSLPLQSTESLQHSKETCISLSRSTTCLRQTEESESNNY